jgi:hypothetical protein
MEQSKPARQRGLGGVLSKGLFEEPVSGVELQKIQRSLRGYPLELLRRARRAPEQLDWIMSHRKKEVPLRKDHLRAQIIEREDVFNLLYPQVKVTVVSVLERLKLEQRLPA